MPTGLPLDTRYPKNIQFLPTHTLTKTEEKHRQDNGNSPQLQSRLMSGTIAPHTLHDSKACKVTVLFVTCSYIHTLNSEY